MAEAALEDVLMACGSADNDIHVFHGGSTDGVAPLLQRLKVRQRITVFGYFMPISQSSTRAVTHLPYLAPMLIGC